VIQGFKKTNQRENTSFCPALNYGYPHPERNIPVISLCDEKKRDADNT
jgi:hypothetical protein